MLQNATSLKKSAPGPPDISDEHVSCTAPATNRIFADPPQMPHACQSFGNCHETSAFCSLLARCWIPCACQAKPHPNLKKCSENGCALYILTSKCASHHNRVHFFDISTSKSAPYLVSFAHFDFEMCFAPQRRALFRHLNFQKCFERGVLCTFWLRNVLRATTACTLSSLISPDGSAPAALASLLEPRNIGKSDSRLFNLFACLHFRSSGSFSSLTFFLLTRSLPWLFPPLLSHLSIMYTCICACMSVYYEEDILWYSTMLIQYTTAKVTKKNAECCLPLNVTLRILFKKQTWAPAFWKTKG